jgi:hypothetical protein
MEDPEKGIIPLLVHIHYIILFGASPIAGRATATYASVASRTDTPTLVWATTDGTVGGALLGIDSSHIEEGLEGGGEEDSGSTCIVLSAIL